MFDSELTGSFWAAFNDLPEVIQKRTVAALKSWQTDPRHPGLRFKKLHSNRPIYSIRVNKSHRVVGELNDATMTWFWVGPHDEYIKLINSM